MSKKDKKNQQKPGSCPIRGIDCIERGCERWIVDVTIVNDITTTQNGRCESSETNSLLSDILNTLENIEATLRQSR